MVDIREIAANIYLIDDQLYGIPQWGSVYLIKEDKKALIDTGPSTSAKAVLEGIKKAGVKPGDMDYLVATHIHLDHAGGAGTLCKEMPNAQVVVHPRGARHMADPTKLVAGVLAAMGAEHLAQEGEVVPIPAERIKSVADNEEIKMSDGQVLKFMDAPGHAPHELCIYETRNKSVFTGDAAGVSVNGNSILFPACQPPNFDMELYLATLDRVAGLQPARLCFSHFGESPRIQADLDTLRAKLRAWVGIAAQCVKKGKNREIASRIMSQVRQEAAPVQRDNPPLYEHLVKSNLPLNISGFVKYYLEKHGLKTEAE